MLGEYSLQAGLVKRWYADVRKKHWGSVVKRTEEFLSEKEVFLQMQSEQENRV